MGKNVVGSINKFVIENGLKNLHPEIYIEFQGNSRLSLREKWDEKRTKFTAE